MGIERCFWAFVGRRAKSKRWNIASLRNKAKVLASSTKGKLEVLYKHYEQLGRENVWTVSSISCGIC